jgi:hypothetical protein
MDDGFETMTGLAMFTFDHINNVTSSNSTCREWRDIRDSLSQHHIRSTLVLDRPTLWQMVFSHHN